MEFPHKNISETIIGAAFEVHNVLGYGFLEKVYKHALKVELEAHGITSEVESEIFVFYKGVQVGLYKSDLIVEGSVVVEVKIASEYNPANEAQLLNELKATNIKVGLLINFGRTKVSFKRFIF